MTDIDDSLTNEDFEGLPLVIKGESKEVRYAGGRLVVIRFKPTIYSFTHQRARIVPGSEIPRLRASKILHKVIQDAGIQDAYFWVGDRFVVADLLRHKPSPFMPNPFRPADLTDSEYRSLRVAPPIEVIVKARHTGTSKHRYWGMDGYPMRSIEKPIGMEGPYPQPLVRFDWRNPVWPEGTPRDADKMVADEVLGESWADLFIDTFAARETALKMFKALNRFLNSRGLDIWDICFFISEDGTTNFGEIDPDCMRVRTLDGEALDKDVFRRGGSDDQVLEKWNLFVEKIS